MKLKLSSLAALSLIAFGCHAPVHRAPKAPTDPNAVNAKQKSTPCDIQASLITLIKTKHADAANILVGQMNGVTVSGTLLSHVVATFSSAIPASTPAPGASPAPSASPGSIVEETTTDNGPAPSASPSPSAAPTAQALVASDFIDPNSCAIAGYLEAPVVADIDNTTVTSCDEPEKAMGKDGATKALALVKYDDTFKSPYEAQEGISLFEVYSLATSDDGTKTLTQYLFDQPSCHADFYGRTLMIDPNAPPSPKVKKSGS